ncbi:PrtD family type I secretion system ABC transporter [Bradyrhizobium barranii subsp. barranii]
MAAVPGVRRSELGDALRACRTAFVGVGLMSCMINLLYLTGSIFMLEVYDRVLPSRSVPTLVGLIIIASFLYMAQGMLDMIRNRILGRIGTALDEALNKRVFDTVVRLPLLVGSRNEGLQPLRDLDNVRSFLGGMGPSAFFDLPWLPLYLAICFAFHVMIGLTALVGAIILVGLTLVTEFLSRQPAKDAMGLAAQRNDLAASSRRNAEVMVSMGMTGRMNQRWSEANEKYLDGNQRASDVAGGLGAVAKVLRMMLQSAVLAVGAYLVIHQEATAGIIIAGSILSARALAPVDLAIAHWKSFVAARQSWQRLTRLLEQMPPQTMPTQLQAPTSRLSVEGIAMVPPWRSAPHRAGRQLRAHRRQWPRRDRAERLRQIVADPRAGRRLASGPGQGEARRRCARPVGLRHARPPHRLSAAGRRIVRRHHRAEHQPFRSRGHL